MAHYNIKIGVYRGMNYFLVFALKIFCGTHFNRLIEAVLTCTNNLCFEEKSEKSIKLIMFTGFKKRCILYMHVCVVLQFQGTAGRLNNVCEIFDPVKSIVKTNMERYESQASPVFRVRL